MGGIKTSNNFYRRGVSNNNSFFGFAVQGNYPIIQPQNLYRPNLYTINPTPTPPTPPDPDTPFPLASILFDGSQNYFTYDGITLGSDPFSIQCWVYFNQITSGSGRQIILGSTFGSVNGLTFYVFDNNNIVVDRLGVSATLYSVPDIQPYQWYYLAYTRDPSNNAAVYLNGTRSSIGIQTDNNVYNTTNNIGIWKPASEETAQGFFNGYISNLYISNTSIDPTNSTIPIPTAPFTADENTQLLLNTTSEENPFIDSSPNNFIMTSIGSPPPETSEETPF